MMMLIEIMNWIIGGLIYSSDPIHQSLIVSDSGDQSIEANGG